MASQRARGMKMKTEARQVVVFVVDLVGELGSPLGQQQNGQRCEAGKRWKTPLEGSGRR